MQCGQMSYQEQLQQLEWREKSKHILQLHDFTCERCGSKNTTLNVHHKRYERNKMAWEYSDDDLECLCSHCHEVEHIPNCCETPIFTLLYDPDAREKMLRPAQPLYCHICGTPLIPGV